jgi:hypothetical protein
VKNVNQRRKYSDIKPFNDCCATALHEATDKFLGDEGAVIRTGGELDLIRENRPMHNLERQHKTNRYIRNKTKVDEASIDRLLQGVCRKPSPDHKENG